MTTLPMFLSRAAGAFLLSTALAHAATPPEVFAPGIVSGPSADADAAFTPDGAALVFSRDGAILLSQRTPAGWSAPRIAPFSAR